MHESLVATHRGVHALLNVVHYRLVVLCLEVAVWIAPLHVVHVLELTLAHGKVVDLAIEFV